MPPMHRLKETRRGDVLAMMLSRCYPTAAIAAHSTARRCPPPNDNSARRALPFPVRGISPNMRTAMKRRRRAGDAVQ